VYVIELRAEIIERDRKFRKANPQYQEGRECLYVRYDRPHPESTVEATQARVQGLPTNEEIRHALTKGSVGNLRVDDLRECTDRGEDTGGSATGPRLPSLAELTDSAPERLTLGCPATDSHPWRHSHKPLTPRPRYNSAVTMLDSRSVAWVCRYIKNPIETALPR
jgi:hypothetical protein